MDLLGPEIWKMNVGESNKDIWINLQRKLWNTAINNISSVLDSEIGYPKKRENTEVYIVKKFQDYNYEKLLSAYNYAESGYGQVGLDRNKSFELARENGADCIVMDDGFQNPTLQKDFSIIVINGEQGFGNKRVMPSGPLRESINRGLSRTNLVITIGEISDSVKEKIPKHIPLIAANFKIKELPSDFLFLHASPGISLNFYDGIIKPPFTKRDY